MCSSDLFGHEYYWVSISAPRLGGPLVSLFSTMFAAFLVATVGGIILQRRLDRPLRNLARGVENYDPGADHSMLPEEGPQEIAAVAHAFNRMTRRLTEQEAERALMLAGVSHDLRTPLARLRLSLEMMRGHDAGLEEKIGRAHV